MTLYVPAAFGYADTQRRPASRFETCCHVSALNTRGDHVVAIPPHLMNDNKSAHSLSFKPAFSANLLNLKHLYVLVTVIKMIQ